MRRLAGIVLLLASCGAPSGSSQDASASPPSASGSTGASGSASATAAPLASGLALRTRDGAQPCGIIGAAGSIWVSLWGEHALVRLDPKTGARIGAAAKTGSQPCGLAQGGGAIWTADYTGNSTTRVD